MPELNFHSHDQFVNSPVTLYLHLSSRQLASIPGLDQVTVADNTAAATSATPSATPTTTADASLDKSHQQVYGFIEFFIALVLRGTCRMKKGDINGDSVTTFSDCRLMNSVTTFSDCRLMNSVTTFSDCRLMNSLP